MAREALDNLLSACITFAQQMLTKHGTFYPFAYGMSPIGEISMAASYDDRTGITTEQIFKLLVDGLRSHAYSGQYKAVGVCVDARVDAPDGSGKTDAIRVTLEEGGGEAVNVFMPYRKRFLRGIAYGEIFGSEADPSLSNGDAQQIVGPERRERVSYQTWCGEGWMKSRRPVNSDVGPTSSVLFWRFSPCRRKCSFHFAVKMNSRSIPYVAWHSSKMSAS